MDGGSALFNYDTSFLRRLQDPRQRTEQFMDDGIVNWNLIRIGYSGAVIAERDAAWHILRVVKLPSREDLDTYQTGKFVRNEIAVYKRLEHHPHPCIVRPLGFDEDNFAIYMPFLPSDVHWYRTDHDHVEDSLKLKWCVQMASAVAHLHSLNIYHGDLGVTNLLLDDDLNLRVCDFAGSSLDFRPFLCTIGPRFGHRSLRVDRRAAMEAIARLDSELWMEAFQNIGLKWSVDDLRQWDLCTMGTVFYYIETGHIPFPEVQDDAEVLTLYRKGVFPDTSCILLGELVSDIWHNRVTQAEDVYLRAVAAVPIPG